MKQFLSATLFFFSALFVTSCTKQEKDAPSATSANKVRTVCTGSCDDLSQAPYNFICVQPSDVGTDIDPDFNAPHLVSTPTVTSIGTLLVFLVGTNAEPNSCSKFYKQANDMGYHVIGLSYVNAVNVSNPCSGATASSLQDFCKEVFAGNGFVNSPMTDVDINNCTLTRLKNLLAWLNTNYSSDGWNQFYNASTGNISWNKIVIAGRSQGGTHAAMIGNLKNVKRVICFSSPREMCSNVNSTWPTLSLSKYYCFSHTADNYTEQQTIWSAMGFTETPTDVDTNNPPYNNAHLLTTSISVNNSSQAHKCTTQNCNLPAAGWASVWGYLLTL